MPAQPRAASSANVAPGRAIAQASDSATAQPGLQGGAIPPGQFSQDDANRASALAGLSSLVSPGLAQQLAGTFSGSSSPSGMPSSVPPSSSNSSNQPGGMPLGGDTQSSTSSSSNSSLGQFTLPNSSASSDEANELIMPPRPKQIPPEGAIDVRFEIVVVCRKDDVILQPGNYRLTGDVLRSGGQGSDCMLAREIRAMVRNRAIVDPLIRQKPAIRFLVETQGADTFALARRQLLFSLPDWPVSLQVAGVARHGHFQQEPVVMSPTERDSGARSVRPSAASGPRVPDVQDLRGQALDSSSRAGSIAQVLSVVICVAAITAFVHLGSRRKALQPAPVAVNEPVAKLAGARRENERAWPGGGGRTNCLPPAPPEIDRAAVAQAEAELDAASRDRARADERAGAMARAA